MYCECSVDKQWINAIPLYSSIAMCTWPLPGALFISLAIAVCNWAICIPLSMQQFSVNVWCIPSPETDCSPKALKNRKPWTITEDLFSKNLSRVSSPWMCKWNVWEAILTWEFGNVALLSFWHVYVHYRHMHTKFTMTTANMNETPAFIMSPLCCLCLHIFWNHVFSFIKLSYSHVKTLSHCFFFF